MHRLTIDDRGGNGRTAELSVPVSNDGSNGRDVQGRDVGRKGGGDLTPQVSSALLREVIGQHEELDVATLRYHLAQADETARAGCWHAAVNEARSFIEELIVGIAEFESGRRRDVLSGLTPNVESRSGYHECRKYLVTVGFTDADEMDLFKHVYAVASRKGSHPGVTDESWGGLVCHMCWMSGYFLLNRYAAWKSHRRRWPDGTVGQRSRPAGSLEAVTGVFRGWPVRFGKTVRHMASRWRPGRCLVSGGGSDACRYRSIQVNG